MVWGGLWWFAVVCGISTVRSDMYFRQSLLHRVQSLRRKRGRNTGIVVVSRRIAVDSPPFWWKII